MLWILSFGLFVTWGLCFASGLAYGGFIHALLGAAVVVGLVRVIQGRRTIIARRGN